MKDFILNILNPAYQQRRFFSFTKLFILFVLIFTSFLFGNSRIIGVVTDRAGLPVSNVSIQLLPTTYGTVSDENGEFYFSRVENSLYNLKLSHISYEEKFIEVNIKSSQKIKLNIKLDIKSIDLDEVVFVADKTENVNMQIISSKRIKENEQVNLETILKNTTALDITNTVNGQTKISIRGSESKQVTVMVDGVSINSKMTGSFDLNSIPKDMIERVEIYKGGNIELTSQAIGGVINIITKRNFSFENLNGSINYSNTIYQSDRDKFSFDKFNNHSISVNSGFSALNHNLLLSVTYTNFKNEWSYINASPFDQFRPNPPRTHSNAGSKVANSFISISKKNKNYNYNYMFNYNFNRYGMPGNYPSPYYFSYKEVNDFKNRVNFEYDFNDENVLKTDLYYYCGEQYFFIDERDSQYSKRDDSDKFTDFGSKISYTTVLYLINLRTGLEFLRESMNSKMLEGEFHKRDISSVYLSLDRTFEYNYHNILFSIKPLLGVRSEFYSNLDDILSFSSYGLLASIKYKDLSFFTKIRYSENHRLPSFSSLFWADNQFSTGTPDLRPEYSKTKELQSGISYDFGDNSISGNFEVYQKDIKNLIVWERTWKEIYRPMNLLKGYAFGTETSINYSYDDIIDISAIYSTLESLHGESKKYFVVYKPLSKLKFISTFKYRNFSVSVNNDYTGIMYINSVNSIESEPFWIHSISSSYKLKISDQNTFKFFASINNIMDKQYQIIKNYPMPGRSIEVGIKYEFK